MGNPRYANGHRRRELRKRILASETNCALCGMPVDKTLPHLDPWAAVIDEDLPVSRGGSPLSRQNCSLLHRRCNYIKGTKTLAEMRALGTVIEAPLSTSRAW